MCHQSCSVNEEKSSQKSFQKFLGCIFQKFPEIAKILWTNLNKFLPFRPPPSWSGTKRKQKAVNKRQAALKPPIFHRDISNYCFRAKHINFQQCHSRGATIVTTNTQCHRLESRLFSKLCKMAWAVRKWKIEANKRTFVMKSENE